MSELFSHFKLPGLNAKSYIEKQTTFFFLKANH